MGIEKTFTDSAKDDARVAVSECLINERDQRRNYTEGTITYSLLLPQDSISHATSWQSTPSGVTFDDIAYFSKVKFPGHTTDVRRDNPSLYEALASVVRETLGVQKNP